MLYPVDGLTVFLANYAEIQNGDAVLSLEGSDIDTSESDS